jgi:hypothetical protein
MSRAARAGKGIRMTDQYGQQPPGSYPPQPPTPGGMAPPPPPPPGAFPQPGAQPTMPPQPGSPQAGFPAPAPAPKKKRTGLVIGIVVGVLALCGLGACAIGVGVLSSSNAEKDIITQAEQHFGTGMKDVEAASVSLKKTSSGSAAEITAAIADANKKLRDGRDEVAAARVSAERLKDSAGKTDYLNSLKAATATLDALQDMVGYMDTASGMAAKATQAAALTKSANASLNKAIDSGNAHHYSTMRSQAVSASTNYTKAAVLFRDAHALDPKAGLDKAAVYAEKRKLQADIVVRMGEEGKAGRLSAYNADIKKQAALSRQAEAAGTPAIVSNPNWAENRLADLGAKIESLGKQADDLRAKALKELGVTE